MKTKKGDFIALSYIAKIKEEDKIFDLTEIEDAKKHNLYNPNSKYEPIIICIGQQQVVSGLDNNLENKEINKQYTIELTPEKAFGKKDPKLFKLIQASKFKEKNINPVPGLPVQINNLFGIIKSVSGGRILIDFNHPLAGKHIIYTYTIKKILTNDKEKLQGLIKTLLNTTPKIEFKENNIEIDLPIPQPLQKQLITKIKELIPSIKKISFKTSSKP